MSSRRQVKNPAASKGGFGNLSKEEKEIVRNQIIMSKTGNDYVKRGLDVERENFQKRTASAETAVSECDSLGISEIQPKQGNGRRAPRKRRGKRKEGGIANSTRKEEAIETVPKVFQGDLQWSRSLPILKMKERILSVIKDHQVVTIEGRTGCGKTLKVPQFVLDEAIKNKLFCKIVVTQPRRIAAVSVANRVASERKCSIGSLIGYSVGMDKRISEDTQLIYMTTGVLLQLLIGKKSLEDWTHIIVDEVHERDLETDFLLLIIKKLMTETGNSRVKIIMMSATLNATKFIDYFPSCCTSDDDANVEINLEPVHPIEEVYLEEAIRETNSAPIKPGDEAKLRPEVVELAVRIIESFDGSDKPDLKQGLLGPRGAVLVFLPGLHEIESMEQALMEACTPGANNDRLWKVLPLHSLMTTEEQQRVFQPDTKGSRKIILATNIAESSITIPDIHYVIDFCLTKYLCCDSSTNNYASLQIKWASKNECIQRRGRCGRLTPGKAYRLVTRQRYEKFVQEPIPEMLRSSLESVTLQVKQLDMGSPKSILALAVDPPSECNIKTAVCNLKEIGAMTTLINGKFDAYDGELTFMGRAVARLPIDVRLGRLVLLGHVFGCFSETLVIAAGLSVKTPFANPYSDRLEAYLQKLRWSANTFSDCISLVNVYASWLHSHYKGEFPDLNEESRWAGRFYVQLSTLREMKAIVEELQMRLHVFGIQSLPSIREASEGCQDIILKVVIAGAFYPNYFLRKRPPPKDYQREIRRELLGLDPLSAVVFHGYPENESLALYKQTINGYLEYKECGPHLETKGTKVVAHFESHVGRTGTASTAVYRAIKLRQLRNNGFISFTDGDGENDSAASIRLKGPSSPVEMEFMTLCGSTRLNDIRTDGQSVNSVVLDQDPWEQESSYQLLVGASVAIGGRSGKILVRDTTLMPEVPGLTGILTMLFCPKLEFRTDETRMKYTGCIAGLGTDPTTGESLYEDHDMEITFEVVFSDEDIKEINWIRQAMSKSLTDHGHDDKVRSQERRLDIRQRLQRLISSKRSPIEEDWPEKSQKWTKPRKDFVTWRTDLIFTPHETPIRYNQGA